MYRRLRDISCALLLFGFRRFRCRAQSSTGAHACTASAADPITYLNGRRWDAGQPVAQFIPCVVQRLLYTNAVLHLSTRKIDR